MHQTCTPDLFVKWLYGEATAAEAAEAKEIIKDDLLMREEFEGLKKAYRMLPKVRFNAAPETLEAILEYSRHSAGSSRESKSSANN